MSVEHWVWLSNLRIDRRLMHRLLDRFIDAQRVFEATEAELCEVSLSQTAQRTVLLSRDLKYAQNIVSFCAEKHIGIVTMQDAAYPNRLRNIEVPPVLLYVSGHMPSFDEEAAVTVVGTRESSGRANEIAHRFGYELADKGMLVVSGMAKGIDAAANTGALDAGARTVAVLGGGVDVCYPESSRGLYNRILAGNGCLISEYPPGERPLGRHFPERNRIMSGLSAGVLVIAAPERSGSLITASRALEQGREIFVVPGNVDDFEFVGSNNLIKHGAIPVTTPKDIVAYYYARFPSVFDAGQIVEYMRDKSDGAEIVKFNRREREPQLHVASAPSYAIEGKDLAPKERRKTSRNYDFGLFSIFSQKGDRNSGEETTGREPARRKQVKRIADPVAEPVGKKSPARELSEDLQKIVASIASDGEGIAHIDHIVNESGFQAAQALAMLTELELEGVVEALPGKRFKIIE